MDADFGEQNEGANDGDMSEGFIQLKSRNQPMNYSNQRSGAGAGAFGMTVSAEK